MVKIAVVAVIALSLVPAAAAADPDAEAVTASQPVARSNTSLTLSYLWDGGALPFIWGAWGADILLDKYVTPRETPMFFSATEGGAPQAEWEVPGMAITGMGIGVGAAMVLGGGEARWYHVKGLVESVMTSRLITSGIKVTFGRHRPDWSPENNDHSDRVSFPSGHSTKAFAIASYSILYLRGHVFPSRRGSSVLPWWEAATYVGIGLAATAIAGERVIHNRHNISDVLAGSILGTASSTLFYLYQDRRFRAGKERAEGLRSLQFHPEVSGTSAGLGISGVW
jgi:membrane-associated phospholipid phosphatase